LDDEIAKLNNGEFYNKLILPDSLIKKLRETGTAISLQGKSLEELQGLLDQGKLDDQTRALVESLIALGDQYTDTLNQIKAETIGSTFDEIADSIVSLFENGTTATEDFANNFEKIMQKSIINTFKRQFLEKQLQGFYDQFEKYTNKESGYALTDAEIEDLRNIYNNIITNAKEQFDALEKATGITFGGDQADQSISGNIQRSITEATANTLEGIWRGQYELSKQMNSRIGDTNNNLRVQTELMNKQLTIQMEIRDNTAKTATLVESMDRTLTQLNSKVGANGADLAANGRNG
jgi:hypothetical protein